MYVFETSIQFTIAELSEIIRDLYLQAYINERSLENIRRNTAKHLQKSFQQYNPSFDEEDFYQMDIGTSGSDAWLYAASLERRFFLLT